MFDNTIRARRSLPNRFHDDAALYFVRVGEFEESFGSRVLQLNQGSLWFMRFVGHFLAHT